MDCLVPREEAVPANSQQQQIAPLKNPEAKSATLIAGQKIQILRTVRVGPALLPAKATKKKKKLRASAPGHVQLLSNQSDASIEPWLQIRKSSNQRQYYNVKRPSVCKDPITIAPLCTLPPVYQEFIINHFYSLKLNSKAMHTYIFKINAKRITIKMRVTLTNF